MNRKSILLKFTIFLLTISCSKRKAEVIIDNPTKSKVEIEFNGEKYVVDTLSQQKIYFSEGKNVVTLNDTTLIYQLEEFDNHHNRPNFLLNPTKSTYILEERNFSRRDKKGIERLFEGFSIKYDTIRIMNVFDISGNYKKTNDYIIRKNWDYGFNDDFPKSFNSNLVNKSLYRIKIYREKQFLNKLIKK